MSKAKEYYDKSKHKDDWNINVVYPETVDNIIELSKYEGVLLGLKICKEMFSQGQLSHENIYENEVYYNELLSNKLSELASD